MIELNPLLKDFNEYRNNEAINFHTLMDVWNYSLNHVKVRKKETTNEMILGQILHMILLENVDINDLVLVCPRLDKRKKEDKETYELLVEKSNNEYKYLIDEETFQQLIDIYENFHNILNNYESLDFIKEAVINGEKEYSFYYDNYIDNNLIKVKSRLDIFYKNIIIDLKTTVSSSPKNFINDINKYYYREQLVFYAYGLSKKYYIDINEFELYIMAIEKFPPYDMTFYKVDINENLINFVENLFRKYIYQINNPKYSCYTKQIIRI